MPKSQLERLWVIGSVFVAFFVLVIGYLFFISPQRDQTSQVDAQVAVAQQQNDALNARISALAKQNKDLARYESAVKSASLALPATSGLPDFLRTLQAIGDATLAKVIDLKVGAPAPMLAPVATASTPTPGAPTPTPTPATNGTVVPPAPSIYVLTVTSQVSGAPTQLGEFLRQLQSVQPRAVLISQLTETDGVPGGTTTAVAGQSTLQLTMSVFVSANQLNAAIPGAGVATP